jgi:hypothetical protein
MKSESEAARRKRISWLALHAARENTIEKQWQLQLC